MYVCVRVCARVIRICVCIHAHMHVCAYNVCAQSIQFLIPSLLCPFTFYVAGILSNIKRNSLWPVCNDERRRDYKK